MAACTGAIGAAILNDCASKPIGGLEQVAYLFNRVDITATLDGSNPNLVTNLDVAVGKQGYKLTGYRKNMDAGADGVISETLPKTWNQFFSFHSWSVLAAEAKNIDAMDDIVVIYESKNKGAGSAGAFHMLGYDTGLFVSSDAKRANTDEGIRALELTAVGSPVSEHIVLKTDYATTYALLESLMTTQT